MSLAHDTFSGTADTALDTHTADTGQSWITGVAGFSAALTGSGGVYANPASAVQNHNILVVTPPSADYSVEADITFSGSNAQDLGLWVRALSTADTGYRLVTDIINTPGSTEWQLYSGIAGSYTQIGIYVGTGPPGPFHAKLSAVGTTITVNIDGTDRIIVTDSNVSAAGNPGIQCVMAGGAADAGSNISNLTVTDLSGGGGGGPVSPFVFRSFRTSPRR
jgi:hypothetical protein